MELFVYEAPRAMQINCPPEGAVNTEIQCEAHVISGNTMNIQISYGDDVSDETFPIAGE